MSAPTNSLSHLDPPPVHQRRFLVNSSWLLTEQSRQAGDLIQACRWWQEEYVGGLFVSIPGAAGDTRWARFDAIRRLLSAGWSSRLITFYVAGDSRRLEELAWLVTRIGGRELDDQLNAVRHVEVAEVVGIGATDLVGATGDLVNAARTVALTANQALGEAELPLPVAVRANPLPTANPPPQQMSPVTDEEVVELLNEGARRLAPEFEQRIYLLRTALVALHRTHTRRCVLSSHTSAS